MGTLMSSYQSLLMQPEIPVTYVRELLKSQLLMCVCVESSNSKLAWNI